MTTRQKICVDSANTVELSNKLSPISVEFYAMFDINARKIWALISMARPWLQSLRRQKRLHPPCCDSLPVEPAHANMPSPATVGAGGKRRVHGNTRAGEYSPRLGLLHPMDPIPMPASRRQSSRGAARMLPNFDFELAAEPMRN